MTAQPAAAPAVDAKPIRFEIRPSDAAGDPRGGRVARDAQAALGITPSHVRTAKCYLIAGPFDEAEADRLLTGLLADPVLEVGLIGASECEASAHTVEVWPLPGVMDPAAQTVRDAAAGLLGVSPERLEVTTGQRYDLSGITAEEADSIATKLLSNAVIERTHRTPWQPEAFPHPPAADQTVRVIAVRDLDDVALASLSQTGHLFLNVEEMRTIREHFASLGRDPTDIELETLAQTWSEHCVHKTLKSRVRYEEAPGTGSRQPADIRSRIAALPGATSHDDGSITIDNLLRSTVAAATHELIAEGLDWTLSVFVDNSGVIRFDDRHAVCVKVETHNRPSAIEPYGGAATGIGGCIRDVIGTGLGAKPIANTDVFCVADPRTTSLPPGVLHPRRVLTRVVDGVRDYGNRMGIPTVNGSVHFDARYIGNPLVFAGCIGLLPDWAAKGEVQPGDRIIAIGGRTGKDGIHGATFSSGELTDTHADEFSHAVQIGNAIEEKRTLDAILRARDVEGGPLFNALTDCGAGGFSSAIGEMGERVGAVVRLENAPLKYAGLRYDEIWISESQERMVLAVPAGKVSVLRAICDEEGVELADLGHFGHTSAAGEAELMLTYQGNEVGSLGMPFLHDGLPMPTREAKWDSMAPGSSSQEPVEDVERGRSSTASSLADRLLTALADPNVASKRWIVRQYDHEVQGNTVVKPLVGGSGEGPADGSVIQPVPGSQRGLAIAGGMGIARNHDDPYATTLAAIDECVRNLVCVGADSSRIAILDNFCWPSCSEPRNMGALVRACAACYDGAKAYRTPFVSGKDSLNNQFRYRDRATGEQRLIEIPFTLLISGVGIVNNIARTVTSDLKPEPSVVYLVGGIALEDLLDRGPRIAHRAAEAIAAGHVLAAHDLSDGGWLSALAEMLIGTPEGLVVDATVDAAVPAPFAEPLDRLAAGYLLQIPLDRGAALEREFAGDARPLARVTPSPAPSTLTISTDQSTAQATIPASKLRAAFTGTLDW